MSQQGGIVQVKQKSRSNTVCFGCSRLLRIRVSANETRVVASCGKTKTRCNCQLCQKNIRTESRAYIAHLNRLFAHGSQIRHMTVLISVRTFQSLLQHGKTGIQTKRKHQFVHTSFFHSGIFTLLSANDWPCSPQITRPTFLFPALTQSTNLYNSEQGQPCDETTSRVRFYGPDWRRLKSAMCDKSAVKLPIYLFPNVPSNKSSFRGIRGKVHDITVAEILARQLESIRVGIFTPYPEWLSDHSFSTMLSNCGTWKNTASRFPGARSGTYGD